jgi:hypothetical protein
MRELTRARIGYEGHLLRSVRRQAENAALARQVARICLEANEPLPVAASATLAGDPVKLRGLPAVGGRGSVGGAVKGTLPHVAGLNAADRALSHALSVLVRDDANGASPGSEPLEETLRKEAEVETARLLAGKPGRDPERWIAFFGSSSRKRTRRPD